MPGVSEDWKRTVITFRGAMTTAGAVVPQPVVKRFSSFCMLSDHTCQINTKNKSPDPNGTYETQHQRRFLIKQSSCYLDITVLTLSTRVWDLEVTGKAHFQMVSIMGDDSPGTFSIGWEILRIIGRFDGACISMDGSSTS